MKKILGILILFVAFAGNAMAFEKGKLVERHVFRLMSPDDSDIGSENFNIEWDATGWWGNIRTLKSISQRGSFNSTKVQKQTYLNWFDHSARFVVQDYTAWIIGKNDRTDLGFGLMNNSNDYKGIRIAGLKAGDIVRFEYYRNNSSVNQFPQFESTNATHRGATVTSGQSVYGTDDIIMNSDGDLDLRCPPRMLLRQVIITHATYQKATYSIEEVHDAQNNIGYKYTITGPGVLEEKHGAVPYITMRFGHDDDMTVVRNYGDNNYAASCVIDPEHDLDITHDDVMINFNYKKRYQNQNGQYVPWANDENHYNQVPDQYVQEATKEQAKNEVELLKGQEFTLYSTSSYDWNEEKNWILERSRAYKWTDNFHDIWPLYGTYFYFFPEVQGKLSVKFYCEGNGQHMPFWWKAQDGEVVDQFVTGVNNNTNQNIYEYNDIQVVRGGAYYLCANPTLIESEHPVVRLISYKFIPDFRVEPLYDIVENGSKEVIGACEIIGGPFVELNGNVDTNETGKYKTHKMEGGQPVEVLVDFKKNGENAPLVKCLGNIESCVPVIETRDGKQYLDIKDIKYKSGNNVNKGGAIVVNICCDAGKAAFVLTVAYEAAEAEWGKDENDKDVRLGTSTEVKRWDFFTEELSIGQYKNGSGAYPSSDWINSSLLYKEVNKFDGMTTDWVRSYANMQNEGKEPIFKSVYDMEGDNADMLEETEGLVFFTESNLLGIYNENETSTSDFQDRYIGIMGDADMDMEHHPRKLIIPLLKEGDRVVIKMGTYGNADSDITTKTATLKLTNAQDAVGNDINSDYVIGGSGVNTGNDTNNGADITDKSQPWGEYHFISKGGDFILEVKDADLLKIYSIVIYRNAKDNNADILTENELLGDEEHRQILNTSEFTIADNVQLHLHYRGLNEATNYTEHIVPKTGNLQAADVVVSSMTSNQSLWYTYSVALPESPAKAKFGVFKARLGVQTIGEDYVTDYADCMIPVGYRETLEYPYTWDFTDLKKYASPDTDETGIDENGDERGVADEDADLRIWDKWNLRVKPEEWDGNIFVSGGQLYGGKTMFDETRGIGITHDNNNTASMTGTTTDETGGLSVGSGSYGFIIPQLDKNQAIYVRAAKVGGTQVSSYEESDGTTTYAYGKNEGNVKAFTYHATASDGTGDEVFAMVMPNNLTKKHDVRLNFMGYEIKKIAVATDQKSLNKKGYASESRDHAIDASLLPYFTGKPMRTYTVTGFDKGALTVELNDVAVTNNYVVPANTGVVIFNDDTKVPTTDDPVGDLANGFDPFDVYDNDNDNEKLNSSFHLFVPDMHDQTGKDADLDGNLMVAALEGLTPVPYNGTVGETDMTNYVLSFKYKKLNGNNLSETMEGPERFYRVYSGNNVNLRPNSAYMQLPTKDVAPGGDLNHPTRVISFRHNNFMRGDVNSDRMVDVADFTGIANHILGRTPEMFIEGAADVNRDNEIDVADFTGVANIILGKGNGTNRAQMVIDDDEQNDMLYVEPFEAVPGTQQVIAVRMTNYIPATGYEFTLTLPEGMTFATDADAVMARLSTARTSERKTDFFGSALQADGSLKVLCGTSRGDDYGLFTFDGTDGEVALITVNIPADYEQAQYTATVSDGKYSDMFGLSHCFGTTTGISDIAVTFDAEPDTYYTLSGQKLNGRPTQRGFYILNGKKVMVK